MSIYRRIMKYMWPYRRRLLASIVCSILFSLFSALSIYLIIPLLETLFNGPRPAAAQSAPLPSFLPGWVSDARQWVSEAFTRLVFSGDSHNALLIICLIIIAAFFLKNLFGYIQANLMTFIEQALVRDLRNDVYRHIHELPLAYFTNERTGNLISRIMNDVTVVNSGISATFYTLIREPLLVISYLTLCIALSWQLTMITFLVFPLVLLVIAGVGRRVHRESGIIQERLADVTSVLSETISGVKVVKAFGMEEFENRKFRNELMKYFQTVLKITKVKNLASPTTEFLSAIAGGAIIWYGGSMVLGGEGMKASEFLGFLFAMFQLMPPIKELSNVNNRIQEASAAGKRVFQVLDTEPNIRNVPDAPRIQSFEHEIRFDNVSFSYIPGDTVLSHVTLSIAKGQVLAIVGPSGSGKSTLVDLVPRFYDPTEGRITIDGHDLRDIDLHSLREQIGIVTQETLLFNDTVRNNIAYGLDDCPLERVMEAARAANAHTFIMETPHGYDTIIGERGVKLSGGERQRLSLARAILKNPPILILDEATSALDSESEILVQEAIERLMAGRTSIVIAHRLSTVQHADTIVVFERGTIREVGQHAHLVRDEQSLYKRLYDMQFRL